MKRPRIALCLLLVFCLWGTCAARATSLFTLPQASAGEDAPSYGVTAGVLPMSQATLPDGSFQEVYADVTDESYLAFGVRLAEEGYAVESQQVENGVARVVVVREAIRFEVAYAQKESLLTVTYPAGVAVEKVELSDLFAGYVELTPEVEYRMYDLVRLEVTGGAREQKGEFYRVLIVPVTVTNVSTQDLAIGKHLPAPVFHYINADGHYTYPGFYGESVSTFFGESVIEYYDAISPLRQGKLLLSFNSLPALALDDTQGICAITIGDETTGERYVLYPDMSALRQK